MSKKDSDSIDAVVTSIAGSGSKRYVVTRTQDDLAGPKPLLPQDTAVTFTLSLWREKNPPRPGQMVILSQLEKFKGGWRAQAAKPIKPGTRDEGEHKPQGGQDR